VKIDNGTGGSRETSTGKPARVDERGRESINFFAELKRRNVYKVAVAYAVRWVATGSSRDAGLSVLRNSKLGGPIRRARNRDRIVQSHWSPRGLLN